MLIIVLLSVQLYWVLEHFSVKITIEKGYNKLVVGKRRVEIKGLKKKFFKLISLRDDPHILAKSMSLGFGLALLPLPGMNLPLGIVLAKLFRLNIAATSLPALLLTYVSPFLYILNYKTGAIFIKSNEKPPADFAYDLTFWQKVLDFFAHAGPAYLLGCAINATLAAAISYVLSLWLFKNAGKFLKGKKRKPLKIKRLAGFRAYISTNKTRRSVKGVKPEHKEQVFR